MLSTLLFLAVVGGSCVFHVESSVVYKCKNEIIDKIKSSWDGDVPNEILEKSIEYGKLNLKASTPKYIKDEFKGLNIYFTKEAGNVYVKETVYRIPKDGSENSKLEFEVIEAGGAFQGKSDKKYRYPVYLGEGVIACYSCIDSKEAPEGPAAGFVLVRDGDYCEDSYKTALSNLKEFGVDACIEYSYN